jgi:L-lactate dehydrogenase complex protein LldG
MDESTSKEKILTKIRRALIVTTPNPFPDIEFDSSVYPEVGSELAVSFAEEFTKVSGKFIFCQNHAEFLGSFKSLFDENKWQHLYCAEDKIKDLLIQANIPFYHDESDLLDTDAGITFCEYLIARLGSIMVSSAHASGRRLNVYPPVHIVLAYTSQLVPDLKQALANIKTKYEDKLPSLISVITGPSRTADIEKTLIMGAHGPKEIYLFLVDDKH